MPFFHPYSSFYPSKKNYPKRIYNSFSNNYKKNQIDLKKLEKNQKKSEKLENDNFSDNFDDYRFFLNLFGINLYFDDILIICLLLFLYNEHVHDEELFLCLILLLFS